MRWEGVRGKGIERSGLKGRTGRGDCKKFSAAQEVGAIGEGLSSRRQKLRSLPAPFPGAGATLASLMSDISGCSPTVPPRQQKYLSLLTPPARVPASQSLV